MQYELVAQESLREVVRVAVVRAQRSGLPEGHALHITFFTTADGVKLPGYLLKQFPEKMTVVLEHRYSVLDAAGPAIIVQLWFNGAPEFLEIPYAAIKQFYDPGSEFGLTFDLPRGDFGADDKAGSLKPQPRSPSP